MKPRPLHEPGRTYEPCPQCEDNYARSRADAAKERRERIATAVLAGLNAHGGYFGPDAETLARRAAKMADAFIAELDK